MSYTSGQILSLEQIQGGCDAATRMVFNGREIQMGSVVDMWIFRREGAVKFECFVVGFSIMAGGAPQAILATQIASSPYYAVVEVPAGMVCHHDELSEEEAQKVNASYWEGVGEGASQMREALSASRDNMDYSHTRAPQPQVDRSGGAGPFSQSLQPRRGHLSVVPVTPRKEEPPAES